MAYQLESEVWIMTPKYCNKCGKKEYIHFYYQENGCVQGIVCSDCYDLLTKDYLRRQEQEQNGEVAWEESEV